MVNPAIAMGVRGLELPDPLAQYGKIAAIQQAQNQNALAQYQLGAAQRAEQRETARMNALAGAGTDESAIANALLKAGDIKAYADFQKSISERESQRLTRQKTEGEILDAALKRSRSFLDTLDPNAPDAAERYIAWHEANHADPVIGPVLAKRGITADQSRERIMAALQRPGGLAQLINQSKLGTEKFIELNKPVTQVINQGGQSQVIQLPGLGGKPTTVGTYEDVPLPPDVAAQQITLKRAGAPTTITNVQAFVPASQQAQTEFVRSASEERKALRNVPDTIANIAAAKELIPSAKSFMGKGGEPFLNAASFLNNRLGFSINTKGVTDATELRTRLFEGILDNLKKLDSQPSQEQQRVLGEALGNLGTDPAALPRILDRIEDVMRRRVDQYNLDVSDAEKRGVVFPFKPQLELPPRAKAKQEPAAQIPGQAPAAGVTVSLPDGRVMTFPNAKAAADFRKAAGLP